MRGTVPVLLVILAAHMRSISAATMVCEGGSFAILETLPPDLELPMIGKYSTFDGWMRALADAESNVNMAALWAQLDVPSGKEHLPDAWKGPALNRTFYSLSSKGVEIDLVTNDCLRPGHIFSCKDPMQWREAGVVDVTLDNWPSLVSTQDDPAWGVLHAKVLTMDKMHAYSGSANLAWSSLSQTKEMGLMVYNCPALADVYDDVINIWKLAGKQGKIPSSWPANLAPIYNASNPISIQLLNEATGDEEPLLMYPCYSPPQFNYGSGADCGDVLLSHIQSAERFINISLMDYSPTSLYQSHGGEPEVYWDKFDRALRQAAFDGVEVNLLLSNWSMTFPLEVPYWRSIDKVPNVNVHQFRMPATSTQPELSRVNHNKFIVTDKVGYIGTSNWSQDYFQYFAGLGWTYIGKSGVHDLLSLIFNRDWSSSYSKPLF